MIRNLAKTLQEGIRGIDLAARIGGEEFAIILTETSMEKALEAAERLRLAVKNLQIAGVGSVTVSVGIAEAPFCAQNARELLASADAALYAAKEQGRDRVVSAERNTANSFATMDVQ